MSLAASKDDNVFPISGEFVGRQGFEREREPRRSGWE